MLLPIYASDSGTSVPAQGARPALDAMVHRFVQTDPSGAQACMGVNFRQGGSAACDRALARFMLQSGIAANPRLLRDALRTYAPTWAVEVPGWSEDLVSKDAVRTAQDYRYNWGGSTDMPPILQHAPGPTEPFSALAQLQSGGGGMNMMAPMGIGQDAGMPRMQPAPSSVGKWVFLGLSALVIGWAIKEVAGGRRLRIL